MTHVYKYINYNKLYINNNYINNILIYIYIKYNTYCTSLDKNISQLVLYKYINYMIIHVLGVNMFNCVTYTCLSVLSRLDVFGVALRQEYILLDLYSFGANWCGFLLIWCKFYKNL